jgi:hypothetical protein
MNFEITDSYWSAAAQGLLLGTAVDVCIVGAVVLAHLAVIKIRRSGLGARLHIDRSFRRRRS